MGGLSNVNNLYGSGYEIIFPSDAYRTPEVLARMINDKFATIQGEKDSSGNNLYGLNMSQSRVNISKNEITFTYSISNKLTQDDYVVYLYDYELDSNGDLVANTLP